MNRELFWIFIFGLIIGFGICFFLGLYNVATHPVYLNCMDTANNCIDKYNTLINHINWGQSNLSIFKP